MTTLRFIVAPETGTDIVDNLRTIGAVILWAAAVLTALTVLAKIDITKLPGGTFAYGLWIRNITIPLKARRLRRARESVEPMLRELREENTAQHEENGERLEAMHSAIVGVDVKVDVLAGEVSKLNDRATALEEVLTTPTKEP